MVLFINSGEVPLRDPGACDAAGCELAAKCLKIFQYSSLLNLRIGRGAGSMLTRRLRRRPAGR